MVSRAVSWAVIMHVALQQLYFLTWHMVQIVWTPLEYILVMARFCWLLSPYHTIQLLPTGRMASTATTY